MANTSSKRLGVYRRITNTPKNAPKTHTCIYFGIFNHFNVNECNSCFIDSFSLEWELDHYRVSQYVCARSSYLVFAAFIGEQFIKVCAFSLIFILTSIQGGGSHVKTPSYAILCSTSSDKCGKYKLNGQKI